MKNSKSFWTWFDAEFVPALYDSRLYNEQGTLPPSNEDGLIKSKIGYTVGLPRIRQIRFKQGTITVLIAILEFFPEQLFSTLHHS